MFAMRAPIATAKAQNSACTVVRLIRLTPKDSTSTKASGAKIAAQAEHGGLRHEVAARACRTTVKNSWPTAEVFAIT